MAITLWSGTPQSAKLPTSNRASLSTRNSIPILSYPDGSDTASLFLGRMPDTASLSSTLSTVITWVSPATSGNAVLGASIERDDTATDLDSDSFDTEATVTSATNGTSGAPTVSIITFAAPTDFDSVEAGEQFRLKVRVLGSDGSHTIGNTVQIMSVALREPGSASGGGGEGTITGPGSSTDTAIVRWNGTDGTTIQDSGVLVSSTNELSGNLRLVEASTAGSGAPNVLTSTESWKVLTNEGTTAENYHTLPTAAVGLTFTFINEDSDGIRIVANTGDTITIANATSASAGYCRSTIQGSAVTLVAVNATKWMAVSALGTWEVV